MSELNFGHIIKTDELPERDAVHVAVTPIIAGEKLHPGDHVGIMADGHAGEVDPTVGVVDPFLRKAVNRGEKFWLFVYPKTITNLRHLWSHPAFDGGKPDISPHEAWLRSFANSIPLDYGLLMDGARRWIESDHEEYLNFGSLLQSTSIPEEFWTHYEAVTGIKGSGHFFSCSC